jgi:hypothetical protein
VPDHQHSFDVVAHLSAPFEPGLAPGTVQLVVDGDLNVVGESGPHPIQRGDRTHRRGAEHHLDVGSTFLERTSESRQGLETMARQGPLVICSAAVVPRRLRVAKDEQPAIHLSSDP